MYSYNSIIRKINRVYREERLETRARFPRETKSIFVEAGFRSAVSTSGTNIRESWKTRVHTWDQFSATPFALISRFLLFFLRERKKKKCDEIKIYPEYLVSRSFSPPPPSDSFHLLTRSYKIIPFLFSPRSFGAFFKSFLLLNFVILQKERERDNFFYQLLYTFNIFLIQFLFIF